MVNTLNTAKFAIDFPKNRDKNHRKCTDYTGKRLSLETV